MVAEEVEEMRCDVEAVDGRGIFNFGSERKSGGCCRGGGDRFWLKVSEEIRDFEELREKEPDQLERGDGRLWVTELKFEMRRRVGGQRRESEAWGTRGRKFHRDRLFGCGDVRVE